jgi:AraC-like DNA-binding protein
VEASVDLLSILLIVTIFQGAFILSVLTIRYSLRPAQHLFLFLMVLCLVWFQAEFLSVRLPYAIDFGLFYGTRYGAWLVLGPLYYFYVRSIAGDKIGPVALILNLAPFFIFCLLLPLLTTEMVGKQQVDYGMLSTFYSFIKNMRALQYTYAALFAIQFLHVLIYLSISYWCILRYERSLKSMYSKVETTDILWLKTLNILLIAVVAFASVFLAIFFVYHTYNRDLDYLYVVPMAMLTYIISYKLAGVQWTKETGDERTRKYERTALKADQAQRIRTQLAEYMERSKPYLNNELRLQDLADQLHVPAYHLSQVINDQLDLTFFDYINSYRVEEAKRLIASDADATLLEIAFRAGFNNKTSFSNAFRKFTTQTATDFKKVLKNRQSL